MTTEACTLEDARANRISVPGDENKNREVVAWRVDVRSEPERDRKIYDRITKLLSTRSG
jgi:hypothetical protein